MRRSRWRVRGLLLATEIPPFDAVCLALSTVSTGGFMPITGDLSAYRSTFVEIIVAVFMLIGATSIVWHRMIAEGAGSSRRSTARATG